MSPLSLCFGPPRGRRFSDIARRLVAFAFVSIIGATTDVRAADLFGVRVSVGGETLARGFANAEKALRLIESDEVENLFPDYRETDAVSADVQFRGLPVTARFDRALKPADAGAFPISGAVHPRRMASPDWKTSFRGDFFLSILLPP